MDHRYKVGGYVKLAKLWERSKDIPSPDLPEQLENVQQSGNEIAERGMQT